MTVSYWRRTASVPAPPLAEAAPASCDVAVIGAGICGISAALHLERRGLRVCVLDRAGVAGGASGRNAGFLMRGCADNYSVACEQYGRERAASLWRLTEATLAGLRAEGIDDLPSVQRVPSCLLAFDETERDELRRSAAMLAEDGFEARWIEGGSADAPDDDAWRRGEPLGGLVNPSDGAANSVDALHYLAGRVKGPIVRADVVDIGENSRGAWAATSAGRVSCERVMLCANAYAPLVAPALRGVVAARRGQMLALRPRSGGTDAAPRLSMSYYANRGYEYFRQPLRNGASADGTIVVGGWRKRFAETEVGYEDTTTEGVQRGLEGFISRTLRIDPADFEITDRWSGVMGFTGDGLPKIGPVAPGAGGNGAGAPAPGGRVWFVGGFTGHGMSMGYETARLAVGAMLDGGANPFALGR